jgi:hypothetical protein
LAIHELNFNATDRAQKTNNQSRNRGSWLRVAGLGVTGLTALSVLLYLFLLRPSLSSLSTGTQGNSDEKTSVTDTFSWLLGRTGATPKSRGPTSESDFIARFGLSDLDKTCESRIGYDLVRRFQENKQLYCKSITNPKDGDSAGTEIETEKNKNAHHNATSKHENNANYKNNMFCYHVDGWGDRSNKPDVLCDAHNLCIDFSRMLYQPSSKFDASGKNKQFKVAADAFGMRCILNRALPTVKNAGGDFMNDFFRAFQEIDSNPEQDDVAALGCEYLFQHPVIIVVRFEAWNLYHQLGEWLNIFATLEILEKSTNDTQVLLLDMHDEVGPYTDMFALFSPNHPVIQPKELRSKGKVCFKRAILPWEGYGTFVHRNVWMARAGEACRDSQLLHAFTHFVRNQFGLLNAPTPSRPSITLITRKDYMGRHIDRKLQNQQDVINTLSQRIKNRDAEFRAIDFVDLQFQEQVKTIYSKTNILIGMHGAGLTHLIFLPDEAIVIELLPADMKSFTYFRNLAKQANKIYVPLIVSGRTVDTGQLWRLVDVAISIASSFGTRIGDNNK